MEIKNTLSQMNATGKVLSVGFGIIFTASLLLLALSLISVYGTRGYVSKEVKKKEISQGTSALIQLKQNEQKMLSSYNWADKEKGAIRIPVKKAMDMVVKEAK
ncbi:MAG: hypothetical protein HQK83_07365 [Fibrobacteria bacterium]|nr:hypothetical protein [Fibrobacteria bacterium]